MSFSTYLDAVRERAGLPVIYRIQCRHHGKPEHIITINPERAKRFIGQHALKTNEQDMHVTYLEGPGRFRIKRFPLRSSTDPVWPWRVTDAERPGVFGRARTHAAAVELVGVMQANPGQHAQVLDDDDEVIAYINGVMVNPAERRNHEFDRLDNYVEPEPGSVLDRHRNGITRRAELVPLCNCGSVDKYGDDLGEHSPSCPYHLAILDLADDLPQAMLDEVCKLVLRRHARML